MVKTTNMSLSTQIIVYRRYCNKCSRPYRETILRRHISPLENQKRVGV